MALLCRLEEAGRSAARLARLLREQEVPGSNPGAPMVTRKAPPHRRGFFMSVAPAARVQGAEACGADASGTGAVGGRDAPSST